MQNVMDFLEKEGSFMEKGERLALKLLKRMGEGWNPKEEVSTLGKSASFIASDPWTQAMSGLFLV